MYVLFCQRNGLIRVVMKELPPLRSAPFWWTPLMSAPLWSPVGSTLVASAHFGFSHAGSTLVASTRVASTRVASILVDSAHVASTRVGSTLVASAHLACLAFFLAALGSVTFFFLCVVIDEDGRSLRCQPSGSTNKGATHHEG